jgi:hypothetical protein
VTDCVWLGVAVRLGVWLGVGLILCDWLGLCVVLGDIEMVWLALRD